ncbi:MAG TPA: copper-binding protein [Nitrospirales bacterium]
MKASLITSLLTGVGLLVVVGMVVPEIQAEMAPLPKQENTSPVKFMGGTIESVDPAGLMVTIQTEKGKNESFPVSNAAAIQGLAKGDRVSVELDEQGKVLSIVKNDFAPAPKPAPAPEPKG